MTDVSKDLQLQKLTGQLRFLEALLDELPTPIFAKTADGTLLFPGVSTQNTVTALLMIKAARVRIWARPMSGDRKAER